MAEDLVTTENVSKEMLKDLFDAAYMTTSYDSDGDLRVKEEVNCWVLLSSAKDRIQLMSLFTFTDESTPLQRLECVNKINREFIVVRAAATPGGNLSFTHDILIGSGILKRTLISSIKRFCKIPHQAVSEFGMDIVK